MIYWIYWINLIDLIELINWIYINLIKLIHLMLHVYSCHSTCFSMIIIHNNMLSIDWFRMKWNDLIVFKLYSMSGNTFNSTRTFFIFTFNSFRFNSHIDSLDFDFDLIHFELLFNLERAFKHTFSRWTYSTCNAIKSNQYIVKHNSIMQKLVCQMCQYLHTTSMENPKTPPTSISNVNTHPHTHTPTHTHTHKAITSIYNFIHLNFIASNIIHLNWINFNATT